MLKRLKRPRAPSSTGSLPIVPYGRAMLARVRGAMIEIAGAAGGVSSWELAALSLLDEEALDGLPAYRDQNPRSRSEFARAWLSLVVDNDALPPGDQLDRPEMHRARNLLASFFFGVSDVQREAQSVMGLIDEKFRAGAIGQAALLLGLFETDGINRRNNERNLFYEQMIVAFLSERAAPIQLPYTPPADADLPSRLAALAAWSRRAAGVELCLLRRDVEEMEAWATTYALLPNDSVSASPELPVAQWLPLDHGRAEHLVPSFAAFVQRSVPEEHALDLIRCIYFVALATGRIGSEDTMFAVVEWIGTAWQAVGTRILPELHRRCTLDDESLSDALRAVAVEHLAHRRFDTAHWTPQRVNEALEKVVSSLEALDFAEVPEGCYDIGSMLLDELLGFHAATWADCLRLHRIP